MKHISKRALGITAAITVAASVVGITGAQAGGDDTRVEGRATFGGNQQIKMENIQGDDDSGSGYYRFRNNQGTAYGRVLCVAGTKDGPGETAAIGLWIYKSDLGGDFAQGEFVLQYVQEKSGPDASLTVGVGSNLQCPEDGFDFETTVPALIAATDGSYDVDVD